MLANPRRKSAALRRASSARSPPGAEHDPDHLGFGMRGREPKDRPAAADLGVVRMGADDEDRVDPSIGVERQRVHRLVRAARRTGAPFGAPTGVRHGACPDS